MKLLPPHRHLLERKAYYNSSVLLDHSFKDVIIANNKTRAGISAVLS
jgi:hypothetical protein